MRDRDIQQWKPLWCIYSIDVILA